MSCPNTIMSCPNTDFTAPLTPLGSSPSSTLPPFLFSSSFLTPRTNQEENSSTNPSSFEEVEVLLANREGEGGSRENTKREQVVLSIIDEVLEILEEEVSLSSAN